MTTQVDTVELAGRLFSVEGSSLQDARAIRIGRDRGVDPLPIEGQWLDQLDASVRRVDLRRYTVHSGFYADLIACAGNPWDDIARLPDLSVVMKGGSVAVDKLDHARARRL